MQLRPPGGPSLPRASKAFKARTAPSTKSRPYLLRVLTAPPLGFSLRHRNRSSFHKLSLGDHDNEFVDCAEQRAPLALPQDPSKASDTVDTA